MYLFACRVCLVCSQNCFSGDLRDLLKEVVMTYFSVLNGLLKDVLRTVGTRSVLKQIAASCNLPGDVSEI
jgi:hypothetical protein